MVLRVFLILLIPGWLAVNGLVPVPPVYRKAVFALKQYRSYQYHNPLVYSLLNVLIHNKQAKAFVSQEAIELSLDYIRQFDKKMTTNNEQLFRQIIFGTTCKRNDKNCLQSHQQKANLLTPELKEQIILELDKHFQNDDSKSDETTT